ncbi:MAG TPA: histidine phosphatase family protein, partial [Nitrososphaerales archaeon]|nr:histidine phosphatase family protein [Nitrososphaerales archaeon]
MDLFLLRHGEAGNSIASSSMDSQRRLTSQGRVEVATVGDALEALDLDFDVIASSPLSRAKETAEIV